MSSLPAGEAGFSKARRVFIIAEIWFLANKKPVNKKPVIKNDGFIFLKGNPCGKPINTE